MKPYCKTGEHLSRRGFFRSVLATTAGVVVPNFGALFHSQALAAEAKRSKKRCIVLYMEGGASQTDSFDMKPGRPTAGAFRPIQTPVVGMQACEFLPTVAKHMKHFAVIRSMKTKSVDHGIGGYHMHTCYPQSERVPHPEIGAMIAKYLDDPASDLPSFVKMGPTGSYGGSGYLGPNYEPFQLGNDGQPPNYTAPSVPAEVQERRSDLLGFMEGEFAKDHHAAPFASHRTSELRALRLMKARKVFDIAEGWAKAKDRYGDTDFGRSCFMALRLAEAGVPFVEIGQYGYDTHIDNFPIAKANFSILDPAWGSLMGDLEDRGLLKDTLVVWTSEFGRTPAINNRAGRDHFGRAWTVVLAGGGVKGGQHYGASDRDGFEVVENPVSEGDLFATIYTALGINPRAKHYLGSRPIWATPEGSKPIKELLG